MRPMIRERHILQPYNKTCACTSLLCTHGHVYWFPAFMSGVVWPSCSLSCCVTVTRVGILVHDNAVCLRSLCTHSCQAIERPSFACFDGSGSLVPHVPFMPLCSACCAVPLCCPAVIIPWCFSFQLVFRVFFFSKLVTNYLVGNTRKFCNASWAWSEPEEYSLESSKASQTESWP